MRKTYWTLANFLTLGNAGCGMVSLFESLSRDFSKASFFVLLAVIFDFLDGKAARTFKQETIFGKGLDSLSDFLSFGIAPAAFGYVFLTKSSFFVSFLLLFFVLAGAWRLAYFIQWSGEHRAPGMPITLNGVIFPVLFFLHGPSFLFLTAYFFSIFFMIFPIFISRSEIS